MATIDSIVRGVASTFYDGMETSGNYAVKQAIGAINQMDIDPETGFIIPNQRNVQYLNAAILGIEQSTYTQAFQDRVNKVIRSVPEVGQMTKRKYIVNNGIISLDTVSRLDVIEEKYAGQLQSDLGPDAIASEIFNPIYGVFNDFTLGGTTLDEARATAQKQIPQLFTQFARTRVDTNLLNMSREMLKFMADADNTEWFYFGGPSGPTALNPPRFWCVNDTIGGNVERIHGYFVKQEIEMWAAESWDGKIPNTNASTIFTNLGGFNCRHELVPTPTKNVPKKWIDRAQDLGFF